MRHQAINANRQATSAEFKKLTRQVKTLKKLGLPVDPASIKVIGQIAKHIAGRGTVSFSI
ncbi:hypothetical protein COY90_02725 [Candidatus Roizmanbacteria bacterium CG_4_10_14_0_8_um_filter_39_9]|uniref:Uncharacterized protein n=1 Tax=Candidatus Roizmanbacteria bacterium CG_4_10_14_0_8_um_filter_39_9 TaxID=1974829 RepID=A0A2M7QCV1_9BACT|nr:MAG: hypothetical protein COY90_02725 [Candidatus Roizmanbacteria bacterium CG_4_10_14_0_8_um_filter_39_9]